MSKSLPALLLLVMLATACTTTPPGIGNPIDWSELNNWEADNHADAWAGFIKGCEKLRQIEWQEVCRLANNSGYLNDDAARSFFETHFELRPVYAEGGETKD